MASRIRLQPIRSRRIRLGILIAALLPAFAVTQVVVNQYKRQREALADEWSQRGSADVELRPAAAVVDFETALSFKPENSDDRFLLAQALVRSSRIAEARAQLLTLWSEEPGNGAVNLALARLAAGNSEINDAVRYYHAAIDGAWESGATTARREARLELSKLLMNSGQNIRAQAELIAMIDDLPADPALITSVGSLLAQAGADTRAQTLFERALAVDPTYGHAARALAAIEYRAGNYRSAIQHLEQAARIEALDPPEQQMIDVGNKVLALDPSARRLPIRERAKRALDAIAIARTRFTRCRLAATDADTQSRLSDLSNRLDETERLTERDLVRDPDVIDRTMDLAFDIEALSGSLCGDPTDDDRALQLLAGQRRPPTR